MPSLTPNYSLKLFDLEETGDKTSTFQNYRSNVAGIGSDSNMMIIDSTLKGLANNITALDSKDTGPRINMTMVTSSQYTATNPSVESYTEGLRIIAIPNVTNTDTLVQLNINSFGYVSLMKVDSIGALQNLSAGDLVKGHYYFFVYNGTSFVWINATSSDQIYITGGVANNLLSISSTKGLKDSGISISADTDLGGFTPSDSVLPTQKAVQSYVDGYIYSAVVLRPRYATVIVNAPSISCSTGDSKIEFPVPLFGYKLKEVKAWVSTAGTTGSMQIQIRNKTQAVDMLSTRITIDSGATTSDGSVATVIDPTHEEVSYDDIIAIDIDTIHTTPALGLTLQFYWESF